NLTSDADTKVFITLDIIPNAGDDIYQNPEIVMQDCKIKVEELNAWLLRCDFSKEFPGNLVSGFDPSPLRKEFQYIL
uniref:hypothetical protein n=1 Tax=Ferroplasma sp. TaxID=2591003 RepID=UPI0026292C94